MKNLSWLVLVNKYEYLAQVNDEGLAYISSSLSYLERDDDGNKRFPFAYKIGIKRAKEKFLEMSRNEFAERILSGEELITEDWGLSPVLR